MNPGRDKKNIARWLMALVGVGSFLRLLVCFQHNPLDYLFSDPLRHWLNGARLLNPDVIGLSDPILYQVYIFILRGLTGDNRFLIALGCGILSAIMPWTYYKAGRELGISRTGALVVWALVAWMPSLFTIYHYIAMETLLLPLIGLSLWMSGRFIRKNTMASWLVAVLCWTLACLTKSTVVPLAAVCLLYCWFVRHCRVKYAIAGVVLGTMLLAPNAARTRYCMGFYAPLGNSWIVKIQHYSGAREIKIEYGTQKYSFASPSVTIRPLAPFSPWVLRRAAQDTVVKVRIDTAKGAEDWRRAYHALNVGWKERILQLAENIVFFLFAPSWPDGNQDEWDGLLAHHLRWLWAPLIFYILDCNFREFRRRQFHIIPVMVTIFTFFLVFQNFALTEGRYRKPLEPLLLLNLGWVLMPGAVCKRRGEIFRDARQN